MIAIDWGAWAIHAIWASVGAVAGFLLATVMVVAGDADRWAGAMQRPPAQVDAARLAEVEAQLVQANERADFYERMYVLLARTVAEATRRGIAPQSAE